MIALEFLPHPLSPRLLHADLGQGAEAFVGTLDDPALQTFAALAPTPRDLSEAAIHTDSRRFLKRRAITRCLLALRLGVAAEDVVVWHDDHGAPQAGPRTFSSARAGGQNDAMVEHHQTGEPEGSRSGLRLSVAARGNIFALALAPRPVGIDIEPLGETMEPPWNVLTPEQCARLRQLDQAAAHRAFLEIWTAQEAGLKAAGTGFVGARQVPCTSQSRCASLRVQGEEVVVAWAHGEASGRER